METRGDRYKDAFQSKKKELITTLCSEVSWTSRTVKSAAMEAAPPSPPPPSSAEVVTSTPNWSWTRRSQSDSVRHCAVNRRLLPVMLWRRALSTISLFLMDRPTDRADTQKGSLSPGTLVVNRKTYHPRNEKRSAASYLLTDGQFILRFTRNIEWYAYNIIRGGRAEWCMVGEKV